MWKPCGYILHTGEHPISAKYLNYNEELNTVTWTLNPNEATIFPSMEKIKEVYPEYITDHGVFRICVVTDEPIN